MYFRRKMVNLRKQLIRVRLRWLPMVFVALSGLFGTDAARTISALSDVEPTAKNVFQSETETNASSGPPIAPYTVIDVPYTVNSAEIRVPVGSTVGSGSDERPFREHGSVKVRYSATAMYTVSLFDSNGNEIAEDAVGAGKKALHFDVASTARSLSMSGPFLDNSTSLFVYNNIHRCPDLGGLENVIRLAKRYVNTPQTLGLERKLNKCILNLYRSKHPIPKP